MSNKVSKTRILLEKYAKRHADATMLLSPYAFHIAEKYGGMEKFIKYLLKNNITASSLMEDRPAPPKGIIWD